MNNVYKANHTSCLFVFSQGVFAWITHITRKLFTLLENECHELDLEMGSSLYSPMGMSATAYEVYSDALKELSKIGFGQR